MLPTPLLLSIIISRAALSAALPMPAPAASPLRIVERSEPVHTLTDFLKLDVVEPANVEDDSIYSSAAERNPDWDALRKARLAKRAAPAEQQQQPAATKKNRKMKRSSSAFNKVANLNMINKAADSAAASATPTASTLATQITTESLSVSRESHSHHSHSTASSAIASAEPTGHHNFGNYGPVRGKNAQQTVNSVIASLSSAWASNASVAAAATAAIPTAHHISSALSAAPTSTATETDSFSILAGPAPTNSASADATNGGLTTSSGWEIQGEHSGTGWWMAGGVTGACGEEISSESPIVALSWAIFKGVPGATEDPADSPVCGKRVSVEYNGVTVVGQVGEVHQSAMSDILLTEGLFSQLADIEVGMLDQVTWAFI